jgi:hypothetical protein
MSDFSDSDTRALQSADDQAHHGYGERDEQRERVEEQEAWRDEPAVPPYHDAILCVKDALSYLEEPDPEAALASLREAIIRTEAAL